MWVRALLVLFFFPPFLLAQESTNAKCSRFNIYLEQYLETGPYKSAIANDFTSFVEKLGDRRGGSGNDVEFLRLVFYKVHKKFLKSYTDYAPFGELFTSGDYNCLTAAALYTLVLDHFNYDYEVVETNYHVFILVNGEKGRVLLETTDPQYGFVESENLIEEKIKQYRTNTIQETSSQRTYHHFQFDLYNEVDLNELTGLLYYNLAVDAFNKNKIEQSVSLLDRAIVHYKSERIEEFSRVILLMLTHSDLENVTKEAYVNKLQLLRKQIL